MGSLTRPALRQGSHQRFVVVDSAAVGAVRRAVVGYADGVRTDPAFSSVAAAVATELATNLLRHARPGGWILARPLPPAGVEIIAVDRGPGIRDVAAAVEGRAPAPNGLGRGLAAVRSASSYFDVHTDPDRGTVILSIVEAGPQRRSSVRPPRTWAGISVGIDEVCGDGWAVVVLDGVRTVAVVDGLGHGIHASIAADAALGALAHNPGLDGYLAHANAAMRHTRGAAVAICQLDSDRQVLRSLSVGNINIRLLHGGTNSGIVALNGTVGMRAVPPISRITDNPWPPDATLVMWSDGLTSQINLAAGSELLEHDPAVAAAVLHRDHTRDRDDATVVVLRNRGTR